MNITLPVTNIQRFSVHDGPGIRTTVFTKGCPLRCKWCHNPETKRAENEMFYTARLCIGCGSCAAVCANRAHGFDAEKGHIFDRSKCVVCGKCAEVCPAEALELCARDMTIDEIMAAVLRDKPFYGAGGGVTLSGGEPMLHGEKTIALLRALKEEGLHTAIETCGFWDEKYVDALVPLVDLFLYDVKDTNAVRHRENTGVSNESILANLRRIDARGGESVMRCISVHGVNLLDDHIRELPGIFLSLSHCKGIELMPYHAMGGSKSERLGRENDGHREWVPEKEEIAAVKAKLRALGAVVID